MTKDTHDGADRLAQIEWLLEHSANTNNRELLFERIRLREGMKDVSGAIEAAREVAKLFPDDARVRLGLAHLLVRSGRYADALPVIAELLRDKPGDAYLLDWHRTIQQRAEERPSDTGAPGGDDLHAALKHHFGFDAFRLGQEEVIRAINQERPVLAVMPTGRGKSLCFQLPALMRGGLGLVVSPLISLMKDQVDELNRRGIPAATLNSSIVFSEQEAIIGRALAGEYRFLYVAPERFKVASFVEFLPRLNPNFFIIDEAHCISQWGHDFRPDYMRLGRAIAACGHPQVVALTATATPDVQRDIVAQIGVPGMATFIAGFERENLTFAVTPVQGKAERLDRLTELVQEASGPAIIYTASRKAAQEVADVLSEEGIATGVYHAGREHDERKRVQEDFMQGRLQAIAATNAFGMGIDKADIRLVVHHQMPGSIEAYYQEAGRAGRDGKPSRCELLFSFADKRIQEFFIDGSNPSPELIQDVYRVLWESDQERIELSARAIASRCDADNDMVVGSALVLLERMGVIERRSAGEANARITPTDRFTLKSPPDRQVLRRLIWEWIQMQSSDGDGGVVEVAIETIAQELAIDPDRVQRGLRKLADDGLIDYEPPFRGRGILIKRRMDPDKLPIDREALAEKRRRDEKKLAAMVRYATACDCRQRHLIGYFGGRAGDCGQCDACRGEAERPVSRGKAPKKRQRKPRADPGADRPDDPLFESLRAWRLKRSRADDLPSYCILSDRSLRAISAERPTSLAALADCFGIGDIKRDRYGQEILAIIAGGEKDGG